MSDPVWPEGLPVPLVAGYSVTDELPLVRTKMDSGPDRVTRISTAYMTKVSFSVLLAREQLMDFREFFETSCNAGADWFLMPLDTAGSIVFHRSRFTKSPNYSIEKPFYRLSCEVETDERHLTWS